MKRVNLELKYKNLVLRHYSKSSRLPISYELFKFLIRSNCHYCGTSGSNKYGYNGIDRIDSKGGYTEDNVVPCCKHCNMAKGCDSVEEFSKWIGVVNGSKKDTGSENYSIVDDNYNEARMDNAMMRYALCNYDIFTGSINARCNAEMNQILEAYSMCSRKPWKGFKNIMESLGFVRMDWKYVRYYSRNGEFIFRKPGDEANCKRVRSKSYYYVLVDESKLKNALSTFLGK